MSTLILLVVLTPLLTWALHCDLREADRKRRMREALRNPSTPLGQFSAAMRAIADELNRIVLPAMRSYAEAIGSLGKALAAIGTPPVHRWYRLGEPPCKCSACPGGASGTTRKGRNTA